MVLVRKKRSWLEKSGHFLEKIGLDVKYILVYTWLNSLGVASHAWVVCLLRRLKKECKLKGMQVKSVELRLVSCARRNANDST